MTSIWRSQFEHLIQIIFNLVFNDSKTFFFIITEKQIVRLLSAERPGLRADGRARERYSRHRRPQVSDQVLA